VSRTKFGDSIADVSVLFYCITELDPCTHSVRVFSDFNSATKVIKYCRDVSWLLLVLPYLSYWKKGGCM
jgi:hypothetical protein